MARKVLVRLVDDLDGLPSDDVATVTFALDRVTYQIDLSKANADKLRDNLADYVNVARRTGGRVSRGAAARPSGTAAGATDAPAVREWAREQGHKLSDRGRIPANIVEDYRAAQAGGARNGAVRTTRAKATPVAGHAKTAAAAKSSPAKATATAAPKRGKAAAKTAPAKAATAKPAARTPRAAASKTAAKATTAKATTRTTAKATTTKAAAKPAAEKAPRAAKATASKTAAARAPKPATRTRRAAAGKTRG